MAEHRQKVCLVGDGFVGTAFASAMCQQGVAEDFVIIDEPKKDHADGDVLDLEDAIAWLPQKKITRGSYDACKDADIVVITAGAAQKPGETRLQLVNRNVKIMHEIVKPIIDSGFNGIFLVASNPVDILTYSVWKWSGFEKNRVIGSGTALDTSRLKVALGKELGIDARDINAYVMGEHGDSEFANLDEATVAGIPLSLMAEKHNVSHDRLVEIEDQVRNKAYEIINRKGFTAYGVAASMTRICEAILHDQSSVLPVSAPLDGEYGFHDIFTGTPAIIDGNGIKEVLEIPLSDHEMEEFKKSSDTVIEVRENAYKETGL
ncbi:MAG: L-lactate dehydrogenase [Firmicutes bacterium]|uniref:L-lactate dehydrogenase n=1 Tax=Candidatus Gallilactobacillus intestinavium TaxID=2840838 RepID=A0A9D9H8S6_9LACO|nr:L-lactate dehydrogenase [Candidatus Gallilactobacillus intestinavium]